MEFCEIAAGVPLEEYGPDFRGKSALDAHPDVEAAVRKGRALVIKHPMSDERTAYFRGIIEKKDVSEIAYIPLFVEEDSRSAGVIVFDAVHERAFSEDEIDFCSEVAELLGLLLGQEKDNVTALQGCDHQQGGAPWRFCEKTAGKPANDPRLHRDHQEGGHRD